MMRKVCYLTGTRADFGLMRSTLELLKVSNLIDLQLIVTGMHFSEEHGYTINEIKEDGFSVIAEIPIVESGKNGSEMANALGEQVVNIVSVLEEQRPDFVLLLGDRGEQLAAAIAAMYLNIIIVHIHGGERSGTVDESISHAISKIAHYHFVSCEQARDRLVKMGERVSSIYVTGAPGLDEIIMSELPDKDSVLQKYSLPNDFYTLLFHPVVQDAKKAAEQMHVLLTVLANREEKTLVLFPNTDAGSFGIREKIKEFLILYPNKFIGQSHISRLDYLAIISYSIALIGNSSSGIIEAASLGTPVVNIGERQNLRERNLNVIDQKLFDINRIDRAIDQAHTMRDKIWGNIYGNGMAGLKIKELLESMPLKQDILKKVNEY